MKDANKSKEQLINELQLVRQRLTELETSETERKKTEEALTRSEEKLRLMYESVTDGITVTDSNGVVTDLNERAAELHGFSSKDGLLAKHS